jgi:hypothetical protein
MRRRSPQRRRQGGVAAIELALIMLFFMGLLPVVLLFGRALLAYTVMQKSTHDAARYMATLPQVQMSGLASASLASAFARQMLVEGMLETWPDIQAVRITVDCLYTDDFYACGSFTSRVLQVRIKVGVDIPIDFLPSLTNQWLPQLPPIPLRANASLRYDN